MIKNEMSFWEKYNETITLITIIAVVITVASIFFFTVVYPWSVVNTGELQENIIINIPSFEGATHVKAYVESANPYSVQYLNQTDGYQLLPTTLTFDTYWDYVKLHCTYYNYIVLSGTFDNSTFTIKKFDEVGSEVYKIELSNLKEK